MYKQGIPDIDLFIEQDSERTPEPQKFYVIHQGQVLASFTTLKGATKKYQQVKEAIGFTPRAPAEAEQADMATVMAEEWMSRTELYWSQSSSHRPTNKVRR
ncbi:MAG TPA: hypothetical protein VH599_17390 [Ktedonobacterales bacterium]|jgi:hypothetical protein